MNENHTLAVVGRDSGMGSTLYSFDGLTFTQLHQVAESGFYRDLIVEEELVIGGSSNQELRIYTIENDGLALLQTLALADTLHQVSLKDGPNGERILIVMLFSGTKYYQHRNGLFEEAYSIGLTGSYAVAAVSRYSRFIAFTHSAANTYVGIYFNTNYTDPVQPAPTVSATPTYSVVVESDSTNKVEEDITRIEAALTDVKSSANTLEIMAIAAVALLGVIALGCILTLLFRVSNFEQLPSTEEPRFTANTRVAKPANPSKNELAEANEEEGNGDGNRNHRLEVEEMES